MQSVATEPRHRVWSLWAPLSLVIHVGVGLVIVGAVVCEPQRVGSEEILVDLVQPRLAPPAASHELGRSARADRRAGRGQPTAAQRAVPDARGEASWTFSAAASAAHAALATALQTPAQVRPAARAPAARPKASERRHIGRVARGTSGATASSRQPRPSPRLDPLAKPLAVALDGDTALASRASKPTQASAPATQRQQAAAKPLNAASRLLAAMARFESAAPVPVAVARKVTRSLRVKRVRHRRAVAHARAQRRQVSKLLAKMTATTRAASRGAALPGAGHGAGASKRLGLKFYLAGRPVLDTKVVRPPRPRRVPPTSCRVGRLGIPPTTVRMLVDRRGKVPVAYIKHASGYRAFDRCALRHAKRMRFYPGTDATGGALDVWIQLRVEPSVHVAAR
jgi:TonB family protein